MERKQNNTSTSNDEVTLRSILTYAQQLRMALARHGLVASESYAYPPTNLAFWLQNEETIFQETIGDLEGSVPEGSESSDTESFLSASETAALEVHDSVDFKNY